MRIVASLALVLLVRGASAETPPDRRFLQEAAAAGGAHVELCALGAKRATAPEVRALARRMADEQATASKELMQLARRQGVSLPTATQQRYAAVLHRLARLEGAEFDRQYMEAMMDDRRAAIARFEREVEDGRDAEVKSFAERSLPTLRHHLVLVTAAADAAHATAGRK